MKKCTLEALIDDYLFNRLDQDKRGEFEEHYFNCSSCFEKMAKRDELVSVVKSKGDIIFKDEYVAEAAKGETWYEKITSFLTPRQWALATISASLLLIVVFGILPYLKTTTPQFFINDEIVRTNKITLISPVIDTETVHSKFEWVKFTREDVEYRIYIYNNGDRLWTESTKENFIILPEKIKKLMTAGEKYSWQVKAFSPEGTLITVSGKVQFKVHKK